MLSTLLVTEARFGFPYLRLHRKRVILRASSVRGYASTRNHCYFSYLDCGLSYCNQTVVVSDFAPSACAGCCFCSLLFAPEMTKKNYRVRVETNDGCVTVWYETSAAKSADKLILNRVYNRLCGLNVKEIEVVPSV